MYEGRYCCSQLEYSVFLTLNLGVIAPHFVIFASNSILNFPPRLSSVRLYFPIYPSFSNVFRTSLANFEVGKIIQSAFLLDYELYSVTNKFAKTLVAGISHHIFFLNPKDKATSLKHLRQRNKSYFCITAV